MQPEIEKESVCMACKRAGNVCVLVTKGEPCLGPVTQTGCGALCPEANRACYGCYGPIDNPNTNALTRWLFQLGFSADEIKRRFLFINNQAPAFLERGNKLQEDAQHE